MFFFLANACIYPFTNCHERDGVEDSNAEDRSFNNKVKQNKEQKPPRRGKTSRQAEDWGTVRHETLT